MIDRAAGADSSKAGRGNRARLRIGVAQVTCRLFGTTGPRVLLPRSVSGRALHLPELVGAFTLHGMALALLLLLGMHRPGPVDVPSGSPLSMVFLPLAPTPPAASGTQTDAPDSKLNAEEAAPRAAAPTLPDDQPPQFMTVPLPRQSTAAPVTPLPVPAAPDRQEEPSLAPPASHPDAVPTPEPHPAPPQQEASPTSLPDSPAVPTPAAEPPAPAPSPSERARPFTPDRTTCKPPPRPAVDHRMPARTNPPRPTQHGPGPAAQARLRAAVQPAAKARRAALPPDELAPQSSPAPAETGPTSASLAPTAAAAPSTTSNAAAMTAAGAAWRAALSTWLQDHKTYPDAARRTGEQGRVVVRFTVDRTGRVEDVVLVSSSGSASLDEAAQAMLRDARLPPFPAGMTQAQVTATVPIRYALEQ